MDEIIKQYFNDGLTYEEILEFLKIHHRHIISFSTLKRKLRKHGMIRRPLHSVRCSNMELEEIVNEELCSSNSNVGYKRVHKALLKENYLSERGCKKNVKRFRSKWCGTNKEKRLTRRKYHNWTNLCVAHRWS